MKQIKNTFIILWVISVLEDALCPMIIQPKDFSQLPLQFQYVNLGRENLQGMDHGEN